MPPELSVRERQKRDRRRRIFAAAMRLFASRGFHETTVQEIADTARVSRGTVFNYYPYKEAILLEHFADALQGLRERLSVGAASDPLAGLYAIFDELAAFVEANRHLVLPLSYELLNPDPERSSRAYRALPLTDLIRRQLGLARDAGLARPDFSPERLSRVIANTYFLTALQWAAYRHDRSIHDELRTALQLALEGVAPARRETVGGVAD